MKSPSSIFAKFHAWFHSPKGIQFRLECLSYAYPILICLLFSYLLGFPMIAFSDDEEGNREVQPCAEESVSSSPSLPAPSPFRAWGWASDLMAAVEPFLGQRAPNQNISGEGAAPPQAAAPAEVPQADLAPSPSEDQSSSSSSSLEEASVESERGAVAGAAEVFIPLPQFRIARQMEESSLYQRIRQLDSLCGYLIPPQMEYGGYLRYVQTYLNESAELGKNHFESALEFETFEVEILEKKMKVQETLFYLLINEEDIDAILRKSLFENIRREAYEFMEEKIKNFEVNYRSMARDTYRNELRTRLDFFILNLEGEGRDSRTYMDFKRTFMGDK